MVGRTISHYKIFAYGRLLMLVIRKEQVALLAEPMVLKFVERMAAYLHEEFPEECELLEEADLRRTIRYGMVRAERYGLDTEGQIQRWLLIMFTFGCDFDTDPGCEWAMRILGGKGVPEEKLQRVVEGALVHETEGGSLGAPPEAKNQDV